MIHTLAFCSALLFAPLHAAEVPASKPNVIIVLAAELGANQKNDVEVVRHARQSNKDKAAKKNQRQAHTFRT